MQGAAFEARHAADRRADAIRAILPALCEDADQRPVGIIARAARGGFDLRFGHAIQEEDDFYMREAVEPSQSVRWKITVQLDGKCFSVPMVVADLRARRSHGADGSHGDSGVHK